MLKRAIDGSYFLLRHNDKIISEMNKKHGKPEGGELRWFPKDQGSHPITDLDNDYGGETCYIVGKGPSLNYITKEHFKAYCPVICLNESIHTIEKLNLDNPVFVLTQDHELKDSCRPLYSTMLISENLLYWYHDYTNKYVFEFKSKLSVLQAIEIGEEVFGCKDFKLLAFDATTDGVTEYAKGITNHRKDPQNLRFLKHKELIAKSTKLPIAYVPVKRDFNIIGDINALINNLHSKLPTVFAPFLGEFGWFIMWHIRMVDQFQAPEKIVYCRKGEECYFPTATSFRYDWQDIPDAKKAGARHTLKIEGRNFDFVPSNLLLPQLESKIPASFYEKPLILNYKKRGLAPDVVLCCRKRDHAPQRNWQHWVKVVSYLEDNNLTYGIVGQQETSYEFPKAQYPSWDYQDSDAAIEMLSNCKLYIGTDTGVSHLASLVKAPMLVFRYPSPGDYTFRMRLNQPKSFQIVEQGWTRPEDVILAISQAFGENVPLQP
jgi:hypothetical protein